MHVFMSGVNVKYRTVNYIRGTFVRLASVCLCARACMWLCVNVEDQPGRIADLTNVLYSLLAAVGLSSEVTHMIIT